MAGAGIEAEGVERGVGHEKRIVFCPEAARNKRAVNVDKHAHRATTAGAGSSQRRQPELFNGLINN